LSVVSRFPDCGGSAVNPEPAIFSQLPGLQALAEAKLAEFASPVTFSEVFASPADRLIPAVTEAFQLAVIVAVWLPLTVPAVAVKVALVAVPGTAMAGGMVSRPVLLDRFTVTVAPGALESSTVQVAVCPLPRAAGKQATDASCGDPERFTDAACDIPFAVAVMVALSSAAIAPTVTVNPTLTAPGGTRMIVGTDASGVVLERVTVMPPPGAAPVSVNVHDDVPGAIKIEPPVQDTPLGETFAVKLSAELILCPFRVAVRAAVWLVVTVPATTVNVPLFAPAANVT
jgi:hypothetical protein